MFITERAAIHRGVSQRTYDGYSRNIDADSQIRMRLGRNAGTDASNG
jgi:hypothetical protein